MKKNLFRKFLALFLTGIPDGLSFVIPNKTIKNSFM